MNNQYTIRELLRFSPFEIGPNLGNKISFDVYEKEILSRTNYFEHKEKRILTNLFDDGKIVVFLCGYSGNGKTTFINWFLSKNKKLFRPIYINIPNTRVKAQPLTSPRNQHGEDYVTRAIQQKIINEWGRDFVLQEFFLKLIKQDENFRDYFTDLNDVELRVKESLKLQDLQKVIKSLNFNDSFLALTLLLIHISKTTKQNYVICFDNLDDLDIVYLSQRFVSEFTDLLRAVTIITQEFEDFSTYFSESFRFIFSMREGTYAEVSPHTRDNIENGFFYKTVFRFQVSDKEIIRRRLILARKLCTESHISRKSEIIDIIEHLNEYDFYSRKVFLPLFNLDNRKLVTYLVNLGDDTKENRDLRLSRFKNLIISSKTGARGLIYRGLINHLWYEDYLKDFADSPTSFDPEKGLCNPPRVIFTALLNLCNYRSSFERNSEFMEIDKTDLYQLIMTIKGVYDDSFVIDIIKKYFLSHRDTWSHLVTVYDKNIEADSDFQIEKNAIKRLRELELQGVNHGEEYEKNKRTLKRVKVQINPSGFVCLRYVITHFEYYSKLANVRVPLFCCDDLFFESEDSAVVFYEFEKTLRKVLLKVEEHFLMMKKYYETTMKNKPEFNESNFPSSDLVMKHYKDKNNEFIERPRGNGFFHSTRILTKHIGYIDNFRLTLLSDDHFCNRTIPKVVNINPNKDKQFVNRFIVRIIESYVDLLDESYDYHAKNRFVNEFRTRISKIEDSNFLDYATQINLR